MSRRDPAIPRLAIGIKYDEYEWDVPPTSPEPTSPRPSSAELFEMIQAAGSLEEPPYAGLIGLLSEPMAGEL